MRIFRYALSCSLFYTLFVGIAAADPRHDKMRGRPDDAAENVKVAAPSDAPQPPSEQIKKTPLNELSKVPTKAEIRKIEDRIFSMEKPSATVWQWKNDLAGNNKDDVVYVTRMIGELDEALAALVAKNQSWTRIAEYQERIAYLHKATLAQQQHYGAVATAKVQAVTTAKQANDDAWKAKRVTDTGTLHDLHKASVGKILIGKTDIAPLQSSPGAFIGEITPEAELFTRAYLAESPWNLLHTADVDCGGPPEKIQAFSLVTTYSVNGGNPLQLEDQSIDKAAFQNKTSFPITTHGSLTAGGTYKTAEDESRAPFAWMAGVVGELKEGNNKVKLEMSAWCYGGKGVPVASGELTIKSTKATLKAVSARGFAVLPASVLGKSAMGNIRDAVNKVYAAKWDVIDIRAASEWQPVRNAFGVVLHRAINVMVLARPKNTGACSLLSVEAQQPPGESVRLAGQLGRRFVCNTK
jgi:hypothetical protein